MGETSTGIAHAANPSGIGGLASSSTLRRAGNVAVGFGLPFVLVAYLALKGGGYDTIIRSEVGIAAWWAVIVATALGVLPARKLGPKGLVLPGALLAFGVWTALGIGWSESAERSVAEVGRVAALLGIFTLAVLIQGREGLRRTAGGVATAIALVGLLALLSRLHPSWFPANETGEILPSTQARLNYPLNYWNGLAALMAMGAPLLLGFAVKARHTLTRALSAAVIPALALTAFFTLSRGGAIEFIIAFVVFFALAPRRLRAAPVALVSAAGAAILIVAAEQRDDLTDVLGTSLASTQGDEMLAMTLLVCAGVGLVTAALALADKNGIGPRLRVSKRSTSIAWAVTAFAALVIAIGAGLPGTISDGWESFKGTSSGGDDSSRFTSFSGNGRYQLWESALDAGVTDRLIGIGPGTYEYWWAENGSLPTFVRDAHSLYVETLGELGVIGFILILVLIGGGIVAGFLRTRAGPSEERMIAAAGTASVVAFAVAAGVDWMWELTVLPVAFLLLVASFVASGTRSRKARYVDSTSPTPVAVRAVVVVVGLVATIAVAIPLASASSLGESRENAAARAFPAALDDAAAAADVQPYAATPSLQRALVFELQGSLGPAVAAAEQATRDEPTNWRNWLVLSRLEAERGNARASVAAFREARELNPRSRIFTDPTAAPTVIP